MLLPKLTLLTCWKPCQRLETPPYTSKLKSKHAVGFCSGNVRMSVNQYNRLHVLCDFSFKMFVKNASANYIIANQCELPISFQPFQIRRKARSMRNSHAWLNPPRLQNNKRGKSCHTASHRWAGFFVDKGMQNSIYRWQSGLWLSSIKASLLRGVLGPWENIWAEVCGACTTIPPSWTTLLESFTAVCGSWKPCCEVIQRMWHAWHVQPHILWKNGPLRICGICLHCQTSWVPVVNISETRVWSCGIDLCP